MAKRTPGLEWLNKPDEAQIRWAYDYLRTRGHTEPRTDSATYECLIRLGKKLETSADGRELIRHMRDANRQGKWRTSRPELKVRTFRLHKQTAAKLDSLAKKDQVTATDMVETLITDTAKAHASIRQQLLVLRKGDAGERIKTKQREKGYKALITQLETMLSDGLMKLSQYEAALCTHEELAGQLDSATLERAHDHFQKSWTEAQEKLGEIRKEHAGLHDIKRAIDRQNEP